jgi:hypothetical protein
MIKIAKKLKYNTEVLALDQIKTYYSTSATIIRENDENKILLT